MNVSVYIRTGLNIQVTPSTPPIYDVTNVPAYVVQTQPQVGPTYVVGNLPVLVGSGQQAVTASWVESGFYPRDNPSGYVTGVNSTTLVFKSETGIFVTTGQTGLLGVNTGTLTGTFYPLNANPNLYLTGFNSGVFVGTGQTGQFITSAQTGWFYPASNPLGFVSALDASGVTSLNALTGPVTIQSDDLSVTASGQNLALGIFKSNAIILRDISGSITGLDYTDGRKTRVFRNASSQITGVHYDHYRKLVLRDLTNITGIVYQ
jgi:hypothetical protein